MKSLLLLFLFCLSSETFAAAKVAEAIPGEYVVQLRRSPLFVRTAQENNPEDSWILSTKLRAHVKKILPHQRMVVVTRASFEKTESALQALRANPDVELAEPNYIYHAAEAFEPATFASQWGFKNTGQKDRAEQIGLAGVDISVEQAWDIETGSKDVIVGVIDSGIDYNNPNLSSNIWTNMSEANGVTGVDDDNNGYVDDIHGYNFVDNNGNPMDDNSHGTHCAGTIGARGDSAEGIAGIARNVTMMPLKFLDYRGFGSLESAIRAIDYAIQMKAKILLNSWASPIYSELLEQAIQRAHDAGILFVAAAGNMAGDNDLYPNYPASYKVPNVISVAAVDNRGQIAPFSNFGKTSVHIAAPGVQIVSTIPNGLASYSGTSMAAPFVVGVAALLAAHEPQLTNVQIKDRILQTARPVFDLYDRVSSRGILNAYAALTNFTQYPQDANDPTAWQSVDVSYSTKHPYEENSVESFQVGVPGAKQIAIYFSRFEVETGAENGSSYDKVEILDAQGNRYQNLEGSYLNGKFSTIIDGDSAQIILSADRSISKFGFDITKIFWR